MSMTDHGEIFCTVRWSIQDLESLFENRGVLFTKANIDKFLGRGAPRALREVSIQLGWEISGDLVAEFDLELGR